MIGVAERVALTQGDTHLADSEDPRPLVVGLAVTYAITLMVLFGVGFVTLATGVSHIHLVNVFVATAFRFIGIAAIIVTARMAVLFATARDTPYGKWHPTGRLAVLAFPTDLDLVIQVAATWLLR